MTRRHLLGGLAAALCPLCLGTGRGARAASAHWSYEGEAGPEEWGKLDPEFRICGLGKEQSPIDLAGTVRAELQPPQVEWRPMPLAILNNGHTVQINAVPGNLMRLAGERYDLLQFHFHHPSEHLIGGRRFDLECHFVHRSAAGRLAVLGVMIEPGPANAALQPIWEAMPRAEGPELKLATTIDPRPLLPRSGGLFRYPGSLTTPPCAEGVSWIVFREPIQASREQIGKFAQLFPLDARPVQGLGPRFILESS
ncbi:MAG: carbonic anhydrase [Proteobacteria bacterium]|nr:carbonic anhydrase [Pseudomonadota bacterium]MBI3495702.1 carbonic anhydrase [Pseudomonadota bacterium]